LRSRKTQ